MPRKAEQSKSNAVGTAVAQHQAAQRGLAEWPSTVERLEDEAEQSAADAIFTIIDAQRAVTDWTPLDLNRAATLAQAMRLQARDMALLAQAGTLTQGERGLRPNPLLHAIEKTSSLVATLTRHLGLHFQASDPRTRNANNVGFARSAGSQIVDAGAKTPAPDKSVWAGLLQ